MLFIIVVLAVVGFGLLAWFTKNLKWVLGAVVLVIAGLAYQSANIDGYKRKAAEDAQAQVSLLQKRIGTLLLAQALDAKRASLDSYFNTKLDALSRETPYNPSPCLDLSAARRVRAISSAKPLSGSRVPSSRLTSVLQRRSEAP
jgi:cell division protein FtsB